MQADTAHTAQTLGLRGIRILDFTWAGAGPYATEQLCLMGADVVKVETASRPDLLRVANIAYNWGAGGTEANPCFNDMNAGKRSIALDLKTPAGRATALRLAREADVVCDNMRPGKMEALGLGYEDLRNANPGLICCSVSATGRVPATDGVAQVDMPGYAPVFWAEGGGASVTGFPNGSPSYMRAPVDMNAATFFAAAILAALLARERTGLGSRVDCSAVETVTACVGDELLAASLQLPAGGLRGNDRPPQVPNEVFPCAGEDRWIAISVETTAHWLAMCRVLDLSALVSNTALRSRLHRWERRESLYAAISDATRQRAAVELERALQLAGVPAAMSSPLSVLLADEGLAARGFWNTVQHSVIGAQRVGGLAWNMTPALARSDRGGPLLGEHTAQVLQEWLHMNEDEMKRLQAVGAFEQCELQKAAA